MAKSSTIYVCSSCGNESAKWMGKCPECGEWNTFQQFSIDSKIKASKGNRESIELKKIGTVSNAPLDRTSTQISEFDRVLGGSENNQGIVPGSVILISGDPGIGKSTLMLQLALNLSKKKKNVVYVSGEESEAQVSHRAQRIANAKELTDSTISVVSSTDIDQVIDAVSRTETDLVILDSVQTVGSDDVTGFPGSLPQIRYVTMKVSHLAKRKNIPVFLVGHVTKEGAVAGPQLLSHMVDVVLYLEGENLTGTRIIRAFKNRFGDTSEVGIFTMGEAGLTEIGSVENFFIDTKKAAVGSSVTVVQEGSRPIIVEVQSLAIKSQLSFPRRVATGIPEKRLEMILAVLQKYGRLATYTHDIFVNVVGGLKIQETASDLAVITSIASSMKNKPLSKTAAIGEVGLLGEVKSVIQLEKRVREAQKFGFTNIFSAKNTQNIAELVKNI